MTDTLRKMEIALSSTFMNIFIGKVIMYSWEMFLIRMIDKTDGFRPKSSSFNRKGAYQSVAYIFY